MPNKDDLIGKEIRAIPNRPPETGIDTTNTLQNSILDAIDISRLDLAALDGFRNVAQARENTYSLIDTMAQDDSIAAILETYADDVCERNDKGQIIWATSSNSKVGSYVNFLLDTLNVDKHIHSWVKSLVTYGDVYLRLYHESDYGDDILFETDKEDARKDRLTEDLKAQKKFDITEDDYIDDKEPLKESVNMKLHGKDDHYVHYVEMVPNPAEIFELTRFGKTMGYIQAPVAVQHRYETVNNWAQFGHYKMMRGDVNVYSAMDYVHGCLEDVINRQPETVDIYIDNKAFEGNDTEQASTYNVRTGQSLLYNSFRVWRELSLLENSVLLNRLTKSSIVRILNVDIGDMPKEQARNYMIDLKAKIEQRTAINTGVSMNEYTSAGPVENILYIPTHGTQGQITTSVIGGDVDVKSLLDLSYFQNKLYGSMRVPKQFFAQTDDSAGFNGGTSLSIISSRYGKTIKRIQNVVCQMITDIIHLFLLDKGWTGFINKFNLMMQTPLTQEEIDRRENKDNRIRYVGDIMSQLAEIDDEIVKMKILKSLLSPVVEDPEVIDLLNGYILNKEDEADKEDKTQKEDANVDLETVPEPPSFEEEPSGPTPRPVLSTPEDEESVEISTPEPTENSVEMSSEDSYLPNPAELGLDMTVNPGEE